MKIFGWMRGKLNGKQSDHFSSNSPTYPAAAHVDKPRTSSQHITQQGCSKEEFSDWPNSLLAIGTFGNTTNLKQDLPNKPTIRPPPLQITPPQFGEVDDQEYRELLNQHMISPPSSFSGESEKHRNDDSSASQCKDRAPFQRTTSIVYPGGDDHNKDIQFDPKKNKAGFGKKSLSFLLKKAVACSGGFIASPILSPNLRDPIPPPLPTPRSSDHSRIEKILRAMLHKKIYPQRPTPKSTTPNKKYLDMMPTDCEIDDCDSISDDEEEQQEDPNIDNSKWVKTDSEYIVLEI